MRVLITSAGRRTSLIRGFRDAVSSNGGLVFATDADPLAPGLFVADRGDVMPRLSDPRYPSRLLAYCKDNEIDVLVPTIDTELGIVARLGPELESVGTTALVSDVGLIDVSADKTLTEKVFAEAGIRTPRSWTREEARLVEELPPIVLVKPRAGSASVGIHVVARDGLESVLQNVDDSIVQEYIDATEITVDALLDMEGNLIHMVPRIRLKTVGGESVQGVTVPDEPIRPWLTKVMEVVAELGGKGPITVQAFLTTGTPTLVEVNPRFGGGFPLTLRAGGDYPAWIVAMLSGRKLTPMIGEYERCLFMTRSLDETFVTSHRPG